MPVYFAAAALAAFYLCMLPVKLALVLRLSPPDQPSQPAKPSLLLGAAAFEPRLARRHARPFAGRRHSRASLPSPLLLRSALKAAVYLLRCLRLDQLRVHGTLATGDAAQTALLCGAAEAVQAACTPLGNRVSLTLKPDFTASASNIEAAGIIGIRAGHIICAALVFGAAYAAGAMRKALRRIRTAKPAKPAKPSKPIAAPA